MGIMKSLSTREDSVTLAVLVHVPEGAKRLLTKVCTLRLSGSY